jgi:hypothetical protein
MDDKTSSILDVLPLPELAHETAESSPSGLRYRQEREASSAAAIVDYSNDHDASKTQEDEQQLIEKTHHPIKRTSMILRDPHRFSSTSSATSLALFSPNSKKKLQFYSDSEAVPVQLNQVQMQTLRRRHEFQTHIYNLECRVATLTARLAEEVMDRDQQILEITRNQIYPPLNDLATKLDLKREQHHQQQQSDSLITTSSPTQQWLSLESRLKTLDAQMTHSIHVRLAEQQQDHIDELRTCIDQELRPIVSEDAHLRRENMAVRKFEQHAGTMARHYQEERTTRIATMECARQRYEALQLQRSAELNEQMRTLRIQLEDERAERIAQDERNRQYILQTVQKLKVAILEAYGIANDEDEDDGRDKQGHENSNAEDEIPQLSI